MTRAYRSAKQSSSWRPYPSGGVPVEFLVFDDEGHGLAKLRNKLVAYPANAEFLDRHLRLAQTAQV